MPAWTFEAMGSRCELQLEGAAGPLLEAAATAAIDEVRRIEAKYSRYRDDSVVSRINRAAGGDAGVEIDDETAALLQFGDQLHARSAGRFDLSAGVLRHAWDFRRGVPPAPAQLQRALALVGWPRVERSGHRVRLPIPGMELDFGGIGKEYAADRAAAQALARGVAHGFVNLGGDIRVLGPRADGRAWSFGIQHPRDRRRLAAEVALAHGALATSGDYERCFEHAGRRYGHVLDARSGLPVSHWQSISVVAPACVAAGALATLGLLLGDEAPALLDGQGVAWLGIDATGRHHARGL